KVADPWGLEDFHRITDPGRQMREQKGVAYIHIIVDMAQVHRLPDGTLSQMRKMFQMGSPSTGSIHQVVFVGASRFVQSIMNLLARVNRNVAEKVRFVATQAEAISLLEPSSQTEPQE
ncbi:MAG TPA: hypothetical protein VHO69_16510, partial [Phototrophicaceae bacterium]|nr:hypothetical protein [Phototrophicaceae bacterium]